jgi:antirestriction protein ArdC
MALSEKIQKQRNDLVEKIVTDIQAGKPFFWDSGHYGKRPRNAVTNKPYKGINVMPIMLTRVEKGYTDSRWLTFNQAKEKGGSIRKGEHGVNIEFWSYKKDAMEKDPKTGKWKPVKEFNPKTGKMENKQVDREFPLVKPYTIFNVEQADGLDLPKEHEITIDEKDRNTHMENMLRNSEAPISYDQMSRNYYNSLTDEIHVMPREEFKTMDNFYATCAHEIAHSTGAEKRLNRETLKNNDGFGGTEYAKEELRAEMASMFLQFEYGISFDKKHYNNHAAYLQSWAKALKDDPNEMFRAASDAEKATEYIKSKMIEKAIEKTKEAVQEIIASPNEIVNAVNQLKTKAIKRNKVVDITSNASQEQTLSPKEKLQAKIAVKKQDKNISMNM